MNEGWTEAFDIVVEERPAKGFFYGHGEAFMVKTAQHKAETSQAYQIGNTFVGSDHIGKGQPIEIEAPSLGELRDELMKNGFSAAGAQEMMRLLQPPGEVIGR